MDPCTAAMGEVTIPTAPVDALGAAATCVSADDDRPADAHTLRRDACTAWRPFASSASAFRDCSLRFFACPPSPPSPPAVSVLRFTEGQEAPMSESKSTTRGPQLRLRPRLEGPPGPATSSLMPTLPPTVAAHIISRLLPVEGRIVWDNPHTNECAAQVPSPCTPLLEGRGMSRLRALLVGWRAMD